MSQSIALSARPLIGLMNRFARRPVMARAANDNDSGCGREKLLRDALKHFARHGLGAAEAARTEAERAIRAGDRLGYDHWLGICRALDRRMAAALAARHLDTAG